MTQKKRKDDMPADMWLHVATDALARYAAGGGSVGVGVLEDGLKIILGGIARDDPRLAPAFVNAPIVLQPEDAAP